MMLFDPAVVLQPLTDVALQAKGELRVQAETLPQRLRPSLKAANASGVRIRYLVGPKAAYTRDARGQPLLAARPFASGPQAEDLEFAGATGDLLINPRFSEIGRDGVFQNGFRSHAFYLTSNERAVICTAAPEVKTQTICVTGAAPLAQALVALHSSEFADQAPAALRDELVNRAKQHVVVGPEDNQPLLSLLAVPGARVLTSELDQGRAFSALATGSNKTLYVHRELLRLPAVEAARRAGIKVVARSSRFDGTIVWTPGRAFMGSQRLTDAALLHDRDVGLILQHDGAEALRKFIEAGT